MPDDIEPENATFAQEVVDSTGYFEDIPGAIIHVAPERRWGFMEDGTFYPIPREPLKLGGYEGPPPFFVVIYAGRREIIYEPDPD